MISRCTAELIRKINKKNLKGRDDLAAGDHQKKKMTHARTFQEGREEAKPGQHGFSNFVNSQDGFSEDVLRRAFREEKRMKQKDTAGLSKLTLFGWVGVKAKQ